MFDLMFVLCFIVLVEYDASWCGPGRERGLRSEVYVSKIPNHFLGAEELLGGWAPRTWFSG